MMHLVHNTNGGGRSNQSSWLSRWMKTSCNLTGETLNYSSNTSENDLNYITKDILEVSRSVKGLGAIETVSSELVNGSQRLSTVSLRNERSCSYLFKNGQENDEKRASTHEKSDVQFSPELNRPAASTDTSFGGCHFLDAVTPKKNQLNHANLRMLQHKGCNELSKPADLVSEIKKGCQSQSNISLNECFSLFYTHTMSDHHFPGHQPEKTGSEKSCLDCYSLHKLPHCVHDAEKTKICTTLDYVEGGFSQTSNSLLITVNSDASLPKECDVLTTRRVITKINRNIPSDLHSLSPSFSQGKRGVMLEPLTRSAHSGGRGNAEDIKTYKVTINKVSSAETDTIDMNFSKETNPRLGGHSTSSDKALHVEANSDSSSSKALSLKLEILMEHADQTKQKSNLDMDNSPEAEPGYRWVKRLKLSSSHSTARGTKSINLAENSCRKRNNFFSRILESDITRSESTPRIHHGKESTAVDKSINLSKENLGNDSSLSHVWIQRWLRDGSKFTIKKPYTMVDCEPQSLKWALEDLQKDRSPSIRAMALMGKALKSFQPCELEKRGSLTIWNTKAV